MMGVTVKDIIRAHIEAVGGVGLCRDDCGCGLDDLFCGGVTLECTVATHKVVCPECGQSSYVRAFPVECNECGAMIEGDGPCGECAP